jgi:hypothetical protein
VVTSGVEDITGRAPIDYLSWANTRRDQFT